MRILVDTNAYTQMWRGHEGVAEQLRGASEIVMSTIVIGELLYGFRNGAREEANERLLAEFVAMPRVSVIPVTESTADRYGRICTALRRKGTPIPSNDAWIAAHAMESGTLLLTLDAHFSRIDGLAVKLVATNPEP